MQLLNPQMVGRGGRRFKGQTGGSQAKCRGLLTSILGELCLGVVMVVVMVVP